MKINIFKINTFSFTSKTNSTHVNYFLGDLLIVRTDSVKDFVVMLDSKLYFYRHVYYLHSRALKLLGLIYSIIYNFYSLDSLKFIYVTLSRSKLEYASVVRNNLFIFRKQFYFVVSGFENYRPRKPYNNFESHCTYI
jgi:hypothetical protein